MEFIGNIGSHGKKEFKKNEKKSKKKVCPTRTFMRPEIRWKMQIFLQIFQDDPAKKGMVPGRGGIEGGRGGSG